MKQDTYEKLIEVGKEIIFDNGYHHVGLKQILDEAGVPKGSFYHYFKSKEDFGIKILESYSKESLEFLKSYLENTKVPPLKRLKKFFDAVNMVYKEKEFKQGCLLGNCALELSDTSQTFATKIANEFETWQNLFAECLNEAKGKKEIPESIHVKTTASFILNSWEGAVLRMKAIKSIEPMEYFVKMLFQKVLK